MINTTFYRGLTPHCTDDCILTPHSTDDCMAVEYKRNSGDCVLKNAGSSAGTVNETDNLTLSCLY